jgi:hypothetical protein
MYLSKEEIELIKLAFMNFAPANTEKRETKDKILAKMEDELKRQLSTKKVVKVDSKEE